MKSRLTVTKSPNKLVGSGQWAVKPAEFTKENKKKELKDNH